MGLHAYCAGCEDLARPLSQRLIRNMEKRCKYAYDLGCFDSSSVSRRCRDVSGPAHGSGTRERSPDAERDACRCAASDSLVFPGGTASRSIPGVGGRGTRHAGLLLLAVPPGNTSESLAAHLQASRSASGDRSRVPEPCAGPLTSLHLRETLDESKQPRS